MEVRNHGMRAPNKFTLILLLPIIHLAYMQCFSPVQVSRDARFDSHLLLQRQIPFIVFLRLPSQIPG
jgi:hypothetical protein